MVLLGDIYKRNDQLPLAALKSSDPPGKLIGAWHLETLCEDLSTKQAFPVPNTFARARYLVSTSGQDVKDCLLKGYQELNLNFFPAFKFRDVKGSKRLWWSGRDYVQIHLSDKEPFPISTVASMTLKVCVEVERRSLTYSKNMEKYREHGMVWMEKVLSRLPPKMKTLPNSHLTAVTFISCIGMIMNGDYVDFNRLRELLHDMSKVISQSDLQKLQIQSKFTLPKVFNAVIWKLHEDIPYRTPVPPRPLPSQRQDSEEGLLEEDPQEVEEQDDLRPIVRSKAMYLPASCYAQWSSNEVSLLPTDKRLTFKEAYAQYVEKYKEQNIPIRSYEASRKKIKRVNK